MFQYYQRAQVCYAYLSDVPSSRLAANEWAFRNSQWFTRGWTLQELLAPQSVEFFDRTWTEIGTKASLQEVIQSITGINHLFNYSEACVSQKMSWASKRVTTRVEDQAYCLLGLFNVSMPPLYGEGENAFHRLQLEILRKSDDESIFAWDGKHNGLEATGFPYEGMLASSISAFEKSWRFQRTTFDSDRSPYQMTNKGLHLELLLYPGKGHVGQALSSLEVFIAPLNCTNLVYSGSNNFLAVTLVKMPGGWTRMRRTLSIEAKQLHTYGKPQRRAMYIKGLELESQITSTISPRPNLLLFILAKNHKLDLGVHCRYFRGSLDHKNWGPEIHGMLPFALEELWLSGCPVLLGLRTPDTWLSIVIGKGNGDSLWVEAFLPPAGQSPQNISVEAASKWYGKIGPDRSSCGLYDDKSVSVSLKKRKAETRSIVYVADVLVINKWQERTDKWNKGPFGDRKLVD